MAGRPPHRRLNAASSRAFNQLRPLKTIHLVLGTRFTLFTPRTKHTSEANSSRPGCAKTRGSENLARTPKRCRDRSSLSLVPLDWHGNAHKVCCKRWSLAIRPNAVPRRGYEGIQRLIDALARALLVPSYSAHVLSTFFVRVTPSSPPNIRQRGLGPRPHV